MGNAYAQLVTASIESGWVNLAPFGVINVKDYGARGDGVSNDSSAFNAAYAAVPSTGGMVYIPPGTYLLTTSLTTVAKPVAYVGAGSASILTMTPTAATLAVSTANVSFSDLKINNCRFNINSGGDHCKIQRVIIDNGYVGGAISVSSANYAVIRECTFTNSNGAAIRFVGTSSYGVIDGNKLLTSNAPNTYNGIGLETGGTGTGNTICRNYVAQSGQFSIEVVGFSRTNVSDNVIVDTRSGGGGGISIVGDVGGSIIHGNYIETNGYWGIELGGTSTGAQVRCTDNHVKIVIDMQTAPTGIGVNPGTGGAVNYHITGNFVTANATSETGAGISVSNSGGGSYLRNSTIANNTIKDIGVTGINLGGSHDLVVSGNQIEYSAGSAARTAMNMGAAYNTRVTGNRVHVSTHVNSRGIILNQTAGVNNTISDNFVDGGGVAGICFSTEGQSPLDNILTGNTFIGAATSSFSVAAGCTGWHIGSNVVNTSCVTPTAYTLVGSQAGTRGVTVGSGSPESVVTAGIGALFLRTDGGASTTLYVKTSGTGNTGWTAK